MDFDNLYKDLISIICMRLSVLILLGVFFFSFASATIPTDCDSSTIAYFQFENNLLDSYGTHDGGVWSGTPDWGTLKVDSALYFRGDEKIIIPNAVDLNLDSAFTIEMWVRSPGSSASSLFDKGDYEINWVFEVPFMFSKVNVGGVSLETSYLSINTPYHIAVVWNTATETLSLYVNGVSVDSATLSSSANSAGDLIIGDGFTGLIDELAIYDSALSSSVINSHYTLSNNGKDYCDDIGAGGWSSTRTLFNIRGCTFDYGGGTIGVASGKCSIGDADGRFYCDDDKLPWVTTEEGIGCAMGDLTYTSNSNKNFCCPPGSFCNKTDSGLFRCDQRLGFYRKS